eukprot:4954148-Heterocapsa_arctica.AAC.2
MHARIEKSMRKADAEADGVPGSMMVAPTSTHRHQQVAEASTGMNPERTSGTIPGHLPRDPGHLPRYRRCTPRALRVRAPERS